MSLAAVPCLPVIYATAAPDALASFVAARWGIAVAACRFLRRGFNDTYALQAADGRAFILRVSGTRPRGAPDVAEETGFIAWLDAAGVPVCTALPARDGARFAMARLPDGPRAVTLFHQAEGHAPGPLSLADARAQGVTLAALHGAAADYPDRGAGPFPLDRDRLIHRPVRELRRAGPDAPDALRALEAVRDRLDAALTALEPGLTWTRLHGDCHGLNARVSGGRAAFFDFDDGGPGYLAYDLGVFLWSQVSFGRARHDVWHAFEQGYRSVRPLAAADAAALPLFAALRQLWLMGEYAGWTAQWGAEAVPEPWVTEQTEWLLAWERARLGLDLLAHRPPNRVNVP